MPRRRMFAGFVVLATLAGCGGSTTTVTVTDTGSGTGADSTEAGASGLADEPKQTGEVVVEGEGSEVFGPYEFKQGVYTIRFEQSDPTNPDLDFRTESSSFVLTLNRKPGEITGDSAVPLNVTKPSGQTQLTLAGEFYVEVEADHSYVVRFTPQ